MTLAGAHDPGMTSFSSKASSSPGGGLPSGVRVAGRPRRPQSDTAQGVPLSGCGRAWAIQRNFVCLLLSAGAAHLSQVLANTLASLGTVASVRGAWLRPGKASCRRGGGTYLAAGALGCLWLSGGLLVLRDVGHGGLLTGVAAGARNLCWVSPKDAPRGLGSAG